MATIIFIEGYTGLSHHRDVQNKNDMGDRVMIATGKFFNGGFASKTGLLVELNTGVNATDNGYENKLIG